VRQQLKDRNPTPNLSSPIEEGRGRQEEEEEEEEEEGGN
tara:strand:- start:117 stop:233 length:117 start_codon:yes stop_codon:yes gene_type:complete